MGWWGYSIVLGIRVEASLKSTKIKEGNDKACMPTRKLSITLIIPMCYVWSNKRHEFGHYHIQTINPSFYPPFHLWDYHLFTYSVGRFVPALLCFLWHPFISKSKTHPHPLELSLAIQKQTVWRNTQKFIMKVTTEEKRRRRKKRLCHWCPWIMYLASASRWKIPWIFMRKSWGLCPWRGPEPSTSVEPGN